MRILVTGAAGQVGREVVEAFSAERHHHVVGCDRRTLDVTDRDAVFQAVTTVEPDVVVHAAAWTAVDDCEGDPDRAFATNALATRHVTDAARLTGARVCYLSTDYVFDGTSPEPYREWDRPNPLSVYGRSKLGGELELDPGALIVRTGWVCGRYGANLVKTVLRLAAERDRLQFVTDQRGCPTIGSDLAEAVRRLVVARAAGIFHVTNQGAVSWFDVARAVMAAAGLDPARIEPITTAEMRPPRPAPRPASSVLDNAALRLQGMPLLPDFHDPLERLVKELVS